MKFIFTNQWKVRVLLVRINLKDVFGCRRFSNNPRACTQATNYQSNLCPTVLKKMPSLLNLYC